MYPPGGIVLKIADLDEDLRLWVNLCESEGGNLYFGMKFEPYELGVVRKLVRPGDVFFDIGANVGFYSLMASQLVGGEGVVHAFEPASFAYEVLSKNIRLNRASNVVANRVAVGETGGEVELFVNRESGLSSLGQTGRGQVVGAEKVPSVSLDEYMDQHEISRVNFLKIDVEGYEGHVLRGARRLIEYERDLAILCELAYKNFTPLGFSINGVIDWMRERVYEVWEVDRLRGMLVKLETNRISYENNNFLFARPGTPSHRAVLEMCGYAVDTKS